MAKNRFSKAWIHAHLNDPYVKLAQQRKYRSRAAFKLIEIDEQDRLIRPGQVVVDLGSAPGSWSQVLREKLAGPAGTVNGRIVAIDILPMEAVDGVDFLLGDFREDTVLEQFVSMLDGAKADLVLSDMAPNLSGVGLADAARMGHLAELAVEFCTRHLKPQGALVIKCFHGSGYSQIVELFKRTFVTVAVRKPKASRAESAETYLLGRSLKQSAVEIPGSPGA
ncbi:MAG: RlmE family RNA methyltransferase [Burkholderiales bacterium]|nr:MAG: RlmE family RNA methyltransferase [Burkholderiales bacterium]